MKSKAFYLPAFQYEGDIRHGGDARTQQIYENLCRKQKIIFVLAGRLQGVTILDLWNGLKATVKWNLKLNYLHYYLRYILSFRKAGANKGDICFFESQAGPVRIGGMVALDIGLETKCFPHNIESLSGWGLKDPITGRKLEKYLQWEILFLSRMKEIFVISREDLVFCKAIGINAKYFSYRPPKTLQKELLSIKRRRRNCSAVVVFGSGNNSLSLDGNIQVINALVRLGFDKVSVSGFGLSEIKNKILSRKVQVLDSLPSKEYSDLLSTVAVAIVHQEKGTGVLTRIENLLTCGIPVVASLIAARNFYDRDNIFIYQDISEIPAILGKIKNKI